MSNQSESRGRRLVIVADDYGYCDRRNAAILDLYRSGAVSCTSMIVNSHSSEAAAQQARLISMPVGLHFNMTEGRPTSSHDVGSLCDADGKFLGKFGLREKMKDGLVDLNHVQAELQAQIDKYRTWFGSVPGHVDGHQHVHVIPGICDIFARVLADNHIPWTRVPIEDVLETHHGGNEFYIEVVRQSKMAAKIFRNSNLRFAAQFIGMSTMGRNMSSECLAQIIPDASSNDKKPEIMSRDDDVIEWMVHPGYISDKNSIVFGDGPDEFAMSSDREHEFHFLNSDHLKQFLDNRTIRLCSFQQIAVS